MVCLINSDNSDDDVMVWQGMEVKELKLWDQCSGRQWWKWCHQFFDAIAKIQNSVFYLSPSLVKCQRWENWPSIFLMPPLKIQNFNLLKPKSCQISALRGITKKSNLNRKKQPNRNFNISAQRTQIGKYKSNTHDFLKLDNTRMKVISKLCY